MNEFTCHGQLLGDSRALVVVAGELDMATCEEMRGVLEDLYDNGARRFAIDLTEVSFMDSTAIGVLIAEYHRAEEPLIVAVASREVKRILRITGLDTVFTMCANQDEALAALDVRAGSIG